MSKRRVVVTGLGIISPVGSTVDSAWRNVVEGVSGIAPIVRFDVSEFPCRFGGAVKDFQLDKYLTPKEARRMDEFMHYGIAAGVDAMTDSGLDLEKADRFIGMYVNELTLDYGEDGRKAVRLLLSEAHKQNIIPKSVDLEFV